MATWTIEVGGASRKYKTMKFERKLDMNSPTKFTAKVEYSADIDFMNRVVIRRNGTAEWIGYVEGIKSEWDGTTRFLNLAGRDSAFIIWKKYVEDFGNYTEKTAGFFGQVNASELLMFMIRTPYSDPLHDAEANPLFPNNKEGWGMDASKLTCAASITAMGDPQYTTLRMRGLGWRNRGIPFESTTKTVNGAPDISNWSTTGASPYLDDPSNTKYIKYTVGHDESNHAIFDFQDAPADLTSLNSIGLNLWFKHDGSPWWWDQAYFAVYIWVESLSSWVFCFDQTCGGGVYTDWTARTWDLSQLIANKNDLDNIRIKFIGKGSLSTYIGYTITSFSYVKSGSQTMGDYFDVTFSEQEVMGIYIESRMDNDSYPRNYDIVALLGPQEIIGPATIRNPKDWVSVDPDTRLVPNGTIHSVLDTAFLFHSYSKEVTKNYQDWGAGGLGTFNFKNGFMLKSTPNDDPHLATIFCASDLEETRSQLEADGSAHYIALDIDTHLGSTPVVDFVIHGKIVGSSTVTFTTPHMSLDTQYYFQISFTGGHLTITINSDTTTIYTHTWAYGFSLRYLYDAQTWGATEIFTEILNPAQDVDTDMAIPLGALGSWVGTDAHGYTDPWTFWINDFPVTDKYIGIQAGLLELGSMCYNFHFNEILALDQVTPYTGGTITQGILKIRARLYDGVDGHYDNVRLRAYVSIDGVTYKHNSGVDNFTVSTTGWLDYTLDLTDALQQIKNPFTLVNVLGVWEVMVKLELSGYSPAGDETHGGVEVAWMRWSLNGTGTFDNTGLHGDIQETTSNNVEQILVSVTGNVYRDLIHSWQPITTNGLRIRITEDEPDYSWAISQIYVYGTQPLKIRPYLDGLSDPTTTRPTPYAGGPYIKAVSIDNDFGAPVGPLNIARGRLLDDLNFVVQKCYDEYYVPFEWWIELNDDNTLHIASQKGSDKSATIIFERGKKLGGVTREKYIDDTVQRVYVVGEGEQKTQQQSSIWVESQEGMDDVRTFYEEVEHEKSLTPNEKGDPEVSRIVGEVYIKKNATKRDQIVVKVTKDTYDSMAYDVGDWVTVNDILTKTIAPDNVFRIMNIDKEINDAGEQITIYLGYPRYRFEDEMQNLYKQLKQLGAVGVIKPDWTAEGIEQTQVSATAVGPTSQFTASAKNEEVDASKDIKNPAWSIDPAPASSDYKDYEYSGAGTGKSYQSATTPTHGMEWQKTDQWMALLGPSSDDNLFILRVAIVGDAAGDVLDVAINRDPKAVFEIRCHNDTGGSHPKVWSNGDAFKMGLAGNNGTLKGNYGGIPWDEYSTLIGFWFFGYYNGSSIDLSAGWSIDGTPHYKFIRTLQMNHKYRLEIITQSANGIVLFNVYDIEGSQADEQNPVQMVALIGASQATFTVKPLYIALSSRNVTGQDYRAQLYVYRYECSWIRVLSS